MIGFTAPPVGTLPGIGPKSARALAGAGIETVLDLLYHLPSTYEDRRNPSTIEAIREDGVYTLIGSLAGLRKVYLPRRKVLIQGRLEDSTGSLSVRWLDRPYLLRQVEEGEKVLLHGNVKITAQGPSMIHGSLEKWGGLEGRAEIVPVYRSVGGLGPARLRKVFVGFFGASVPSEEREWLADPFPAELLGRHALPSLVNALERLHGPSREDDLGGLKEGTSPAHARLVYGEILETILAGKKLRQLRGLQHKGRAYRVLGDCKRMAQDLLPFEPTEAQSRCFEEIACDLSRKPPMRRLLQGDVGSGKTAVAAQALALALGSGYDAAYMAPTRLLAEQHFLSFQALLGGRFPIRFRSSGSEEGPSLENASLTVGTHALLEEEVSFRDLGLVVIDEQQRFGVAQREGLLFKGEQPDLLVLSATPIPRSLCLTHYGDLDLSILDESPPGRQPVTTELIPRRQRRRVWKRLREELEAGGQAFIVFPAIDGASPDLSLEEAGATLAESLPEGAGALLHGRMDAVARGRIMEAFRRGEVRALVATTVVEVGVDVAGATLMIIEGAETFGLAQLHQLRGRVGRGSRPSACLAIHGRLSSAARRRLEAFAATTDGFQLAEEDLALRGAGDLFGSGAAGSSRRQAGAGAFRIADPVRDRKWWRRAETDAADLENRLEEPSLAALRHRVEVLAKRRLAAGGGG